MSNFISTKPTVEPKITKNTSAKDELKKTKAENYLLAYKSKGVSPTVSKEVVKNPSVCKSEPKIKCKGLVSKTDPKYERKLPKTESNCENSIIKTFLNCDNSTSKVEPHCEKSILKIDRNCEKSALKIDSKCENSISKIDSNCEKQISKTNSIYENTILKPNSNCKGTISENESEIVNIDEVSPGQLAGKSIKHSRQQVSSEVNSLNGKSQTDVEKNKLETKKQTEYKLKILRKDLKQLERLLNQTFELINKEKNELEKNLGLLEKGTSVAKLNNNICYRLDKIRKKLDNQKCNENLKQITMSFCDLKQLVWKVSVNRLRHFAKLSDDKHKTTREMFDCIKTMMNNFGDLVGITLRSIKSMLEYMNIDVSKANKYFKTFKHLEACEQKCCETLFSYTYSSQYNIVEDIVTKIEDSLKELLNFKRGFESYKTLVGNEYQKYADNEKMTE